MKRKVRYEPLAAKTILNRVNVPAMPFEWSINPYRGCQHGCSFCYARGTHSFLGAETDDTFQNRIFLKISAPEVLRRQLDSLIRAKRGRGLSIWPRIGRVAIGTATDPYQPIEAQARLTRGCLEVLADYRVPVSITTRSPLILRDLDLLRKLSLTSINISIGTLDPLVWKQFEPTTPSPAKRFETVRTLAEEGLPAGVFLAPILPLVSDGEEALHELIRTAASSRASFVMASFLRLSTSDVKVWFFQTLARYYPHLVSRYTELYGGSAYAAEAYREPLKRTIRELLDRYGLPSSDAGRPRILGKLNETAPAEAMQPPTQLTFSL